jgi:hypothetical protein
MNSDSICLRVIGLLGGFARPGFKVGCVIHGALIRKALPKP